MKHIKMKIITQNKKAAKLVQAPCGQFTDHVLSIVDTTILSSNSITSAEKAVVVLTIIWEALSTVTINQKRQGHCAYWK